MTFGDQIYFLIKKTAVAYTNHSLFYNTGFLTRIYESEPEVIVLINKNINWTMNNPLVKEFYNMLPNFDKDDYVFIRIGENIDDYEFLGDCYCNFGHHLKEFDLELVREIKFVDKARIKKKEALIHFLEFVGNFDLDDLDSSQNLPFIFEGSLQDYLNYIRNLDCVITNLKNNYISFTLNKQEFIIFKETPELRKSCD